MEIEFVNTRKPWTDDHEDDNNSENNNNSNNEDDNIIIQFKSYLFTCKRKSPEVNYRVSTSKKKETTKYYKQNKM
jgi:hypothetical protein